MKNLIPCESVKYRRGAIEVLGNIHDNCVNIETWQISPDVDLSDGMINYCGKDSEFQANTELELDKAAALKLIEQLQAAVKQLS